MKLMFAAFFVVLSVIPVAAQQNCATRDAVIDRLADMYGESRQAVGMVANGRVLEVYANEENGTWTITVTLPNGMTCIVASGQAYENVSESVKQGIRG